MLSRIFLLYVATIVIPRVINMPAQLYLPNGMLGRIECRIQANPPITLVQWSKNGHLVDFQQHGTRLKVNKQGTLIFRNVEPSDEGEYKCKPHSPMGTGPYSTPVVVRVRDPPFFQVRPEPYYQRQPTQSVTMPCHAEGDPKPTISWRKADGTFPSPTKALQDNGNLTIKNLGKGDQGTYECVATNIVTSVITTTLLLVELSTPHAPYNLSVATSQFEAKVSWLPAYDGGYPQHYVLWFKMQTGSRQEWQTLRVIPDEATSITVYKLFPDTTYQFTVLSRNSLGDGLFSPIFTATTTALPRNDTSTKGYETKPSGNPGKSDPTDQVYDGPRPNTPRNITVSQEEEGLLISWLPPINNSVPILHYKINYRTVGRWVPLTDHLKGDTKFLWTTASRRAKYSFQVFACSKDSHSEPSKTVVFLTVDPLTVRVRISDGVIGGIVGGLLFLFVAIVLAVIAVKIFNKRKQREKAMRYGNVKYFGPKQVEANKNCTNPGALEGSSQLHIQVLPPVPHLPFSHHHHHQHHQHSNEAEV